MSDRWAVALALSAALGALRPATVPVALAVVACGLAWRSRRAGLLCLATMLLTSTLAARSLDGLDGLVPDTMAGEVTLLTDPVAVDGGARAEVRHRGRHLELRASGATAARLDDRLAGERLVVRGELRPMGARSSWQVSRHLSGRLVVFAVESWRPGPWPTRVANSLRRTLADGASSLSRELRSVYTGLVIGDDREQSAVTLDDFRGAGLLHLSAVSGQNVAFVLTLIGPVVRRLRLWPRWGVTLVVIATFGLVTRFEPSVMRAAAMAALACTASTMGSAMARVRVLALTVAGLLVVDPLLVHAIGFRLSVAASAAIVVIAPPLAATLAGPALLRDALAVTIAAQVGVAPVLLVAFGPLPVASLPANLLAVPAAGPVMMWGLTAGVVAGLVPEALAVLIHHPTRLLVGWLVEVAQRGATAPLGHLQAAHLVVVAGGLGLATWAGPSSRRRPAARRLGLLGAGLAVLLAVAAAQAPVPLRRGLIPGVAHLHGPAAEVVVLGGVGTRNRLSAARTLAALRIAGVRAIDLLVVADGAVPSSVLEAVLERHPVGSILVRDEPDAVLGSSVATVVCPRPGVVLVVGSLEVRVTVAPERLVVDARPRAGGADRERGPPR